MRKLVAALAFLWLALAAPAFAQNIVGPANIILCDKSAFVAPSTATTTSIVAGVAGQRINICGWHVTSAVSTGNSFQLIQGTQGGPCASPTNITAPFQVINSAPSADHLSQAWTSLVSGAQLCVITTAATALQIQVFYSQF